MFNRMYREIASVRSNYAHLRSPSLPSIAIAQDHCTNPISVVDHRPLLHLWRYEPSTHRFMLYAGLREY